LQRDDKTNIFEFVINNTIIPTPSIITIIVVVIIIAFAAAG